MAVLSIGLLGVGVAGALARPCGIPSWVLPAIAALVGLVSGAVTWPEARHALHILSPAIGFLLAAVPLALMLDRLGFFSALAAVVTRRGGGPGALWVLAAAVTVVLNLDAAVVLLTPLYVGIARRQGRDPLALAFQPVLLACLASSVLPVSNLTNLIAQAATGASSIEFMTHLGVPSLAACAVGWWCYQRAGLADQRTCHSRGREGRADRRVSIGPVSPSSPGELAPQERRILGAGGVVVAAVLVGFTAGRLVGAEPWMVALGADVVVVAGRSWAARRAQAAKWRAVLRRGMVTALRDLPVGTAVVASALAVLAAGAVSHLPVRHLVGGDGALALARTAGSGALAANVINNLPALLVGLPALGPRPSGALWALLLGVNMGPVILVTGSLASLLWLDALRRLGVAARPLDFTRVGLQVGLPAVVVGFGVALGLGTLGVGGLS